MWGTVSLMVERPYVVRGMPVGVAWVAGQVAEGEKELKKWHVVSAQESRDEVLNGWRHGLD